MITRADLERIRVIRQRVESLLLRRDRLRESIMRMTPSRLSDMPHGNAFRDPMAEYIVRLEAIEEQYTRTLAELEEWLAMVDEALSRMRPDYQMLLRLRYVDGLSWRRIARKMHFSEDWVKHLHGDALRNL